MIKKHPHIIKKHLQQEVRNLRKHLEENGPVPQVHGNKKKRPQNALDFRQIKFAITFVQNDAERYGITHPATMRGRADDPPIFLPASQNFKSVHTKYVASCLSANIRSLAIAKMTKMGNYLVSFSV